MPEILAVIPARGGSKGIPGKNLQPLRGRPLIAHTIGAALASSRVTRTVVSTDDEAIAAVARAEGADVPFRRRAELAEDDVHAADVVVDALAELQRRAIAPDFVVMLLPTAPLRRHNHIDAAIELFEASTAESVIGVCELGHYLGKLRTIEEGWLRPLGATGAGGSPNTQRQGQPPLYYPNGSIYVATAELFARSRTFHMPRALAYVMPRVSGIDIDTPEDLRIAEALFDLA